MIARIAPLAVLALALQTGFAAAQPTAPAALEIEAPNVLLLDAATGTVLFERGADDPVVPASTAKIMTVEYVLSLVKAGTLRRDQTFEISLRAWREGGAPSGGSTMFAKLHSRVAVDDLLRGLIVDSANDAAIALAEGLAGSQEAFAVRLTERARIIGLPRLTFANAWGNADPDERAVARDMAQLARHLIASYPEDYKTYAMRDFLWNGIKQPNRDPLLAMEIGADGLTTGNIDKSGYGIVASAIQNGQRLVLALYGAKTAAARSDEARKALLWGFRTFETRRLFSAGDRVGTAKVYGGASGDVALLTPVDVAVLVPREGGERLTARVAYTGPLRAPVEAGQDLARLELLRGDKVVLTTPLKTAAPVPVGSLSRRALDAGFEFVGALFRKYVLRS